MYFHNSGTELPGPVEKRGSQKEAEIWLGQLNVCIICD
jgi:hypothetical protein